MLLSAIEMLIIYSRLLNKTYILLRVVLHMLWSPYFNPTTKLLVRRHRRKRIETEEKKLGHAEIDGQRVGNNIQGRKKKKKGKRVWEADVGTDETWKGSRKRVKEEEMVSNDGASLQRSHTERQLWLNTNKTHTDVRLCTSSCFLLMQHKVIMMDDMTNKNLFTSVSIILLEHTGLNSCTPFYTQTHIHSSKKNKIEFIYKTCTHFLKQTHTCFQMQPCRSSPVSNPHVAPRATASRLSVSLTAGPK